MGHEFDGWLGDELKKRLGPVTAAAAPAVPRYQNRPERSRRTMFIKGALATTGTKLAFTGLAAASAVGATGLAVAHHDDGGARGREIKSIVEDCRDHKTVPAELGACVSVEARHHGLIPTRDAQTHGGFPASESTRGGPPQASGSRVATPPTGVTGRDQPTTSGSGGDGRHGSGSAPAGGQTPDPTGDHGRGDRNAGAASVGGPSPTATPTAASPAGHGRDDQGRGTDSSGSPGH